MVFVGLMCGTHRYCDASAASASDKMVWCTCIRCMTIVNSILVHWGVCNLLHKHSDKKCNDVETWLEAVKWRKLWIAFHHFINSNDIDRQCWFKLRRITHFISYAFSLPFFFALCALKTEDNIICVRHTVLQCHNSRSSSSSKNRVKQHQENLCKCSSRNDNIPEIYHHIHSSIPL